LPDKDEIQRSVEEMVERVQRMDIKLEKDASGRLTRIVSEGVASDIIYDASGKIDGFSSRGRVTKVRMATDANRNPVLRFFDANGTELQPIDLKAIGLPSSVTNTITANSILPTADMIDVKEFARLERQRALERSSYLLSTNPSQKPLAKFAGDGDIPRWTPQQCQLKCDVERDLGLVECERGAGLEGAACAAGTAGLAELPPVAAAFAIWCGARTIDRFAACKADKYNRWYGCSLQCQ
jgi:hypothetical protein